MSEFFSGGITFNVVSFVVGVVGILLAIFAIYYGRRFKKPVYFTRSVSLVDSYSSIVPELSLAYKGRPIPSLTYTQIAFWNIGNEVINKYDVAETDPIRFVIKDESEILDAQIDFAKKQANKFLVKVSEDKKHILIDFEYFAKNEGITIKVYHTGKSYKAFKAVGTIKGVDEIHYYDFLSNHAGSIVAHFLYINLGGQTNKLWGFVLKVFLFPLWAFLIIFGETLFEKSKYKLVDKKFYLSE